MAGVAAHQVPPADLDQLAAPQGADGLEVPGHQPGNGGLAGAGIAGKDHVHGKPLGLEAGGGPPLLDLDMIRQTKDVVLHRLEAHQGFQLLADGVHRAGVGGGQQVEEGRRGPVIDAEPEGPLPHREGNLSLLEHVFLEAVFAQRPEDPVTAAGQPRRALGPGALGGHIVPHLGPCREGQLELTGHPLAQGVELLGRQGRQALGGEVPRPADIPQGRHKPGAEGVRQGLPPLVGKEDQVFAAGVDPADGPRRQRGPGVHQNSLPVHQIPGGQGGRALGGQIGQRLEESRAALLVVLKNHNLPRGVEGRIEVLQKEFFRPGVGVEGQIQHGAGVALEQPPGRHPARQLPQGKMPPGAAAARDQDHVPGPGRLHPQHKGPAHGPHQLVHKLVLPQHRLFHLGCQPLEAAQVLGRGVGGAFSQEAVSLHILEHLAALGQGFLGGVVLLFQLGVLGPQQLVQGFLLFQQGFIQIGQVGRGLLRLRFLGGRTAGADPPPCAEHIVHQTFPVVVITHSCLPIVFHSV